MTSTFLTTTLLTNTLLIVIAIILALDFFFPPDPTPVIEDEDKQQFQDILSHLESMDQGINGLGGQRVHLEKLGSMDTHISTISQRLEGLYDWNRATMDDVIAAVKELGQNLPNGDSSDIAVERLLEQSKARDATFDRIAREMEEIKDGVTNLSNWLRVEFEQSQEQRTQMLTQALIAKKAGTPAKAKPASVKKPISPKALVQFAEAFGTSNGPKATGEPIQQFTASAAQAKNA